MYKVGDRKMNLVELYRYAQRKGYSGAKGPFFIGAWLYAAKGEKVFENVGGIAKPVGWAR